MFTLASADITSMDDASIAVLSLETGEYHVVLEGGTQAHFSSSGHLVYARAGALLAVPFDLDELRVTGAPVGVVEGVSMSPRDGRAEFVLTRDGSLLYAPGDSRGAENRLIWVDRQGRSKTLTEATGPFGLPKISPDGRYLAVARRGPNNSLWILDIARTTLTPFATGFNNFVHVWTPDGQRVTWSGPGGLMWQAADGSGQAEVLLAWRAERPPTVFAGEADASMEAQPIAPVETSHVAWRVPSSWSPDGKVLAIWEMRTQTGGDIALVKVGDETTIQPFLQTPANESHAVFSPDGEWMAYVTDESGRLEVYVQAFPSGRAKQQVSTGGGHAPLWNPSGGELFYRNGHKVMVVDVHTNGELVLSKPRILFEKLSVLGGYDVTRDGERFVMIERSEAEPPPNTVDSRPELG